MWKNISMPGMTRKNVDVDRDLWDALGEFAFSFGMNKRRALEIALYLLTQTMAARGDNHGRVAESVRAWVEDGARPCADAVSAERIRLWLEATPHEGENAGERLRAAVRPSNHKGRARRQTPGRE